jgi:hypothetical protein
LGARDASPRAPKDAGEDAPLDASTDARDAGFDAGHDAGFDAGVDASPEAGPLCPGVDLDASAAPVVSVNQPGGQNIPAGATPDASTILVQYGGPGGCSGGLSLYIADETPPGSGAYQIRFVPKLLGADTSHEEGMTLEADGLTIIVLTADHTRFRVSRRSAVGLVDFGLPSAGDFAAIAATGSQSLWAPSISADGLAFYYVVQGDPNASTNGIYESVRAKTSVPFPPGTRMGNDIQAIAQYVNGVSADRLSIFLEESTVFGTVVFSRTSLSAPFTNPLAPNAPPTAPGLRTRPLAGCPALVGSCAPQGGGCLGEEVCVWGSGQ